MPLTQEEQQRLDELLKKKGEEPPKNQLTPEAIKKMSAEEAQKVALELLNKKRDANTEAGDYREKYEQLKAKQEEADRKKQEADLTAQEKLKKRDEELEQLKLDNKNLKLQSDAKIALLADGFPEKIVNLGLKGLTEENQNEVLKTFKKEYAEYKVDPKAEPNKPAPPVPPAGGGEPAGGGDPSTDHFNQAQNAVVEMRKNAEK